jgi:Fe-S-cluster containining protein
MSRKKKTPKIPPKALLDIWEQIPKMVDCKGECVMSCGPVPASPTERKLMEERAGHSLGTDNNLMCNMLTEKGLCSVYAVRPMICRLWGTTPKLKCPLGCKPERWLSDSECLEIYRQIEQLDDDENSEGAVAHMVANMTIAQRRQWFTAKRELEEEHGPLRLDRD